jgi:hypothetical protein
MPLTDAASRPARLEWSFLKLAIASNASRSAMPGLACTQSRIDATDATTPAAHAAGALGARRQRRFASHRGVVDDGCVVELGTKETPDDRAFQSQTSAIDSARCSKQRAERYMANRLYWLPNYIWIGNFVR